jgi:hypothetical protein
MLSIWSKPWSVSHMYNPWKQWHAYVLTCLKKGCMKSQWLTYVSKKGCIKGTRLPSIVLWPQKADSGILHGTMHALSYICTCKKGHMKRTAFEGCPIPLLNILPCHHEEGHIFYQIRSINNNSYQEWWSGFTCCRPFSTSPAYSSSLF